MLIQEVLLHGDKVVIQLVDVLKAALLFDVLGILALEVDVSDELAIRCIILRFLFFFKRLRVEHIEAVDLFLLALGFLHADLVNLAAE